jgi:hypothetical protein
VASNPERFPPPPFWRTRYFALNVMARPDRRDIDPIAITSVLNAPYRRERQEDDGRWRLWGWIEEHGKWLRVVLLEDGETVHNAMFDRNFDGRR